MFLTPEQIIQLTGYKVAKCQIGWLMRNGVRHWVAATGKPVVPAAAIDGTPHHDQESQPFEPQYVA